MKLVNIETEADREELLQLISDSDAVNSGVRFDEKLGKPVMHTKLKNGRVKITCEFISQNKKDNEFLVGTYFTGKISEKNGKTRIKGVCLTAPIYHLFLIAMVGVFIWRCFSLGGISFIPIMLLVFNYFLFKSEFKKQGIIKRYIERAIRRLDKAE